MRDGIKLVMMSAAVALPACGDDQVDSATGAGSTGTTSATTGVSATTESPTTTNSTNSTNASSTSGVTEGSASATEGDATSAGSTTNATSGTTGQVSSTSETSGGSSSTGPVCVCNPGEVMGCDGNSLNVCADDCLGFGPQACPGQFDKCVDGMCVAPLCQPGTTACEGVDQVKTCNGNGDGFDPPKPCGATQ